MPRAKMIEMKKSDFSKNKTKEQKASPMPKTLMSKY
jgi:hypothetical protein